MSLFQNETPALGTGTTLNGTVVTQYVVIPVNLTGTAAATAANYGRVFLADRAYKIIQATELHRTLGTDAGAVTLDLEKLTGTQAEGAGVNMTSTNFNLKGTIDTLQTLAPSATIANTQLAAGDRIVLKDTGVLTAVADVVVSIVLAPI